VKNILNAYLNNEYRHFIGLNKDCQRLVISNFVYSFIFLTLPIIANYFIFLEFQGLQQEEMMKYNISYFVGYFVAIPIGFAVNGYLLRYFRINYLYILGMFAEIFVIVPLTFLHIRTMIPLFFIGNVMGISSGLFWSNRHYMSYFVTDNLNRNYVFGLENTLINVGGFITPLIFAFLTGTAGFTLTKVFPGLPQQVGRVILATFLLTLILIASFVIMKGNFRNPEIKPFLFFKYCIAWNKQRWMNILEGLTNGSLIVMPSLIVLHIFKDSSILGVLQSIGILAGLLPVYFLGRYSKPRHRVNILAISGLILIVSALTIAIGFNESTSMAFLLCSQVVFTILYMPYLAIRMRSMSLSAPVDQREEYSYLVDIEITFGIGRILGLGIFLVGYYYFSQIISLRFGFLAVAVVPLIAALLAKTIKQE
jgi:YQGE family putative transporter